jgi:hypothetical protein
MGSAANREHKFLDDAGVVARWQCATHAGLLVAWRNDQQIAKFCHRFGSGAQTGRENAVVVGHQY